MCNMHSIDYITIPMLHTYRCFIMAQRSDMWDFFKKLGSDKAKSTICCKNFAYKAGTTNLRDHLVAKHYDTYRRMKKGTSKEQLDVEDKLYSHLLVSPEFVLRQVQEKLLTE